LPQAVAGMAALLAPLAAYRVFRILNGDWQAPAQWERLTFWSVALLVVTSAAELLAFVTLPARVP
jgi:hypothetical protein